MSYFTTISNIDLRETLVFEMFLIKLFNLSKQIKCGNWVDKSNIMDVYYTSVSEETSKDDLYYESLSGEKSRATVLPLVCNFR